MNCNDNGSDNCMTRVLDCGHEHFLHLDVDPKDFKCPTRVETTLPCGHKTTQKPCHMDVKEWKCGFPCNIRIDPCGHSCIRTCHVNHDPDHLEYKCYKTCDRVFPDCSTNTHKCPMFCHQTCAPCQVIVAKKLPNCNHMQDLECSASGNNIVCEELCTKKIAECNHDCKRKCHETCGGCEEMVMKTVSTCGHEVEATCSKPAEIQNCRGPCSKQLPCGHSCKKKCNEVCTDVCCELVNDVEPRFCGHKLKIECHLQKQQLPNYSNTLLQFCKEPCSAVLECSHKCSGTCSECAQGRIHVTCMEKCGVPLICGHECKVPCREVCQPCKVKCGMKCSHNECAKTCGEVCTKCQESCPRRCIHVECTAVCGDICTVSPCEEPCEKKLPCSHPCVGYCGDPCPPLCRICNADELREVFLGYEDEIDARFVLLDECKHVIESKGMKSYCEQDQTDGIHYIRCPRCRTQLTSTQRYSDYIKRTINDVAAIKRKSCGTSAEIEEKRKELQEQLNQVKLIKQNRVFATFKDFDAFVDECGLILQAIDKNRRQMFDLMIGGSLQAKLTIVQNIGNILQILNVNKVAETAVFLEAKSYVQCCLSERLLKQAKRITNQEIHDFERELNRLQRIAQFVQIAEVYSPHNAHKEMRELIYQPVIYTEIYDNIVKVHLEEFKKKMNIAGGLSNQKRLEIVRAMGLKKGHWYKCPNGHIYAIGECGGAVQVGSCYECGVQIGGSRHALLPSNSHAGEMDDSRHPAYSDAANNILNFQLNDLQ